MTDWDRRTLCTRAVRKLGGAFHTPACDTRTAYLIDAASKPESQSRGHIMVYSEPDKGRTFKFYLPEVQAEGEQVVRLQPMSRKLTGTETVLVSDDYEPMEQASDAHHRVETEQRLNLSEYAIAILDRSLENVVYTAYILNTFTSSSRLYLFSKACIPSHFFK